MFLESWGVSWLVLALSLSACSCKGRAATSNRNAKNVEGTSKGQVSKPPDSAFVEEPEKFLSQIPALPPEQELVSAVTGFNAHISVTHPKRMTIDDELLARIRTVAAPMGLQRFAMVEAQVDTEGPSVDVVVKGVSEGWPRTLAIGNHIVDGNSDLHWEENTPHAPAVVGVQLARHLGLKQGDTFSLVPPPSVDVTSSGAGRVLRVVGIFRSGFFEYDKRAILTNRGWLKKHGGSETIEGVELRLDDLTQAGPVSRKLRRGIKGGYLIEDWCALNSMLFEHTCVPPVPKSEPGDESVEECAANNANACYVQGRVFESQSAYGRAQLHYRKACEFGNADGCARAGLFWLMGRGEEVNYGQAYGLLKKGCQLVNMDACYLLGWLTTFVMELADRGHLLWRYACEQGHAKSCGVLGRARFQKAEMTDENLNETERILGLGCALRDGLSCELLGDMGAPEKAPERHSKALARYEAQCEQGFVIDCAAFDELNARTGPAMSK